MMGTITAVLAERFAGGDKTIVKYVQADGTTNEVSAQQFAMRCMAFAARFGPVEKERKIAAICLYHGLDLHAAFLGAIWSGHIPTMMAPPSPRMDPAKYADSLRRMIAHLKPQILVADRKLEGVFAGLAEAAIDVDFVEPSSVGNAGSVVPHPATPNSIAFLQHSSGTTGLQKGMAFSHAAVLAHHVGYRSTIGLNRSDVVVSWLPLYHDMGLIACFLLPLIEGALLVEMSPFDWVLDPALLLDTIGRERGTLCWLPNFAFQFMARRVRDDRVGADISLDQMRGWINSSEPVFVDSMNAFVDRFAKNGVRRDQLATSYAMAENVYAVTQSTPGSIRTLSIDRRRAAIEGVATPATGDNAVVLVSNGPAIPGTQVCVLDHVGRSLSNNEIGEIAIKSQYLFSGYYHRDDLTRESMTADGWYRTGDLGFVEGGEVFVTGRKKDLIIIQGRNFAPNDIEAIGGSVAGIAPGRIVAFGIPDEKLGTEKLIVLFEMEDGDVRAAAAIARELRQRIAQELDCSPAVVRPMPPRWIVKSTAGKLARDDNRRKFIDLTKVENV